MHLQKQNKSTKQQYNKWKQYEDQALRVLIQKQNSCFNWEHISQKLSQQFQIHRKGKQCRERWENHICQKIYNKQWRTQDDENIYNYHMIYGNSWIKYTGHFEGKTDLHIKNRFNSMIRKALRKMCKFSQLKVKKNIIYQIRPSTISRIFFQISREQETTRYELPDYFSREKCIQIRNLIKLFLVKSQKNAVEIKKLSKASFEVIYKIIQFNECIIQNQKTEKSTNHQQSIEGQPQDQQKQQSSQLIDSSIERINKVVNLNNWEDLFNVITELQNNPCKFLKEDNQNYDHMNTENSKQFDQRQHSKHSRPCRRQSFLKVIQQN